MTCNSVLHGSDPFDGFYKADGLLFPVIFSQHLLNSMPEFLEREKRGLGSMRSTHGWARVGLHNL